MDKQQKKGWLWTLAAGNDHSAEHSEPAEPMADTSERKVAEPAEPKDGSSASTGSAPGQAKCGCVLQ